MTQEEYIQSLIDLHAEMVVELRRKIKDKEATAADLKLAWEILKENNLAMEDLKASLKKVPPELTPATDEIPHFDDEEQLGPIGKVG